MHVGQNLEILQKLAEGNVVKGNPITKTNMNNMLMQLRKYVLHALHYNRWCL